METFDALAGMTMPWASQHVQDRIAELSADVPVADPDRMLALLQAATADAVERFRSSASLYAGANVPSRRALRLENAGLGSRPTLGPPGEKFPTGVEAIDIIEVAATQAVRALMRSRFADVRLPSATLANLAVLTAFTEPGDTIAALPEAAGGHVSHRNGAPRVRGLHVASIPYDYDRLDVDLAALPEFLSASEPKLVIIGASMMLRPHRVGDIAAVAHNRGIPVLYDGSHFAGLIALGLFQKPLHEGADILTFSTYKSFGGPAGGVICTDDPDTAAKLSAAVYPVLTANYDVARLGPLALAASELLAEGGQYGRMCIANARLLGEALADNGLAVLGQPFGYTESHHLAIDVREFGGGAAASGLLARAGVFLSPTILPLGDSESEAHGLRMGTQELTRRGYTAEMFRRLADITGAVLRTEIDASLAAAEVAALAP